MACYGVYATKDGKYLSVGALEPKFWLELNKAIGRTGNLAELVGPPEQQDKLRAELAAILASKTRDEWSAILLAHDCLCEPVLEPDELADHPLHQARGVFFTLDGGALGPIRQLRTPLGVPETVTMPPKLGEHSRAVLAEYGFSETEIGALLG
jgi:crotonobetainyl-CoA:carnitine CoA-transferase CaiB-like acyl-CoA transferase